MNRNMVSYIQLGPFWQGGLLQYEAFDCMWRKGRFLLQHTVSTHCLVWILQRPIHVNLTSLKRQDSFPAFKSDLNRMMCAVPITPNCQGYRDWHLQRTSKATTSTSWIAAVSLTVTVVAL